MKSIKILMMAVLTILSITVFAQHNTKHKMKKATTEKTTYVCPMHPEVIMDKAGKCPKCGMDLTKSKKEQMKMDVMKIYTCPMHSDVTSDKAGICPKCGMKLKKEATTLQPYSCPMHADMISNMPGKCSKCGMDLTKSKKE